MAKGFIIAVVLILGFSTSQAQTNDTIREYMYLITDQGDTLPYYILPEANIVGFYLRSKKEIRKYNRLKEKVIKVYPYANVAGVVMEDFGKNYDQLNSKKEKRQFAEDAENKVKQKFEGDIRDMRVSEGVILIKLIDRQTGESSYELVKKLRNGMNAFMWQTVARLFGHDLKSKYDPKNNREDQMIEDIVDRIESGEYHVDRKLVTLDN